MITTEDKIGFLQTLKWDAEDQSASVYSLLKSSIRGQFKSSAKGMTVIGTAGNGRSTTLALPDSFKTMTQDDVRRLFVHLLEIYNDAIKFLGITAPGEDDDSKDDEIFAAMMDADAMQKCTSFREDYTMLGVPSF